jgi:lactoylglutathione lyase
MADRPVPIQRLFESHLTVSDLQQSVNFYRDLVGLPLALELPERNAAFFWVGEAGESLLGLWSLGSAPLGLTLHLAFEVSMEDLLEAPKRLEAQGIVPLSFFGVETTEPSVIGWMPAASLFFHDPDGHLLEYLTMLEEDPRPDLGIVSWSEWLAHRKT